MSTTERNQERSKISKSTSLDLHVAFQEELHHHTLARHVQSSLAEHPAHPAEDPLRLRDCGWDALTHTSWPYFLTNLTRIGYSASCSTTIRGGQVPCPRSAHFYTCQMTISKGKQSNSNKTCQLSIQVICLFPPQTRQNPATSSWISF